MDKKLFEQRLTEVSEWQIPKLTETDIKEARQRQRGRGRVSNEELYQQAQEDLFIEEFDGINPTHPPQIVKLKNLGCVCDDCGRHCENGRHLEKKIYEANKKRHWREKCLTCDRFKNPYTGEFDLAPSVASTKWNAYLRETKNAYASKGNLQKAKIADQRRAVVISENHSEIIRFYPDTKQPL